MTENMREIVAVVFAAIAFLAASSMDYEDAVSDMDEKGAKGGLTKAIRAWVERKRFQFQNEAGRFMSYEQTAFAVTRSIWNRGLKPTLFITKTGAKLEKKARRILGDSYTEDLAGAIAQSLKGNNRKVTEK